MQENEAYAELSTIRHLMERSSKFISLSGLAGIMAGLYALAGAGFAFTILSHHIEAGSPVDNVPVITRSLVFIAVGVLTLSSATSYWLTARRAKRKNERIWNPVSRRLLVASGIPFFTGGFFILILLLHEDYSMIAPASLVFYGLAVFAGSQYTYQEVKWLGVGEIMLGLVALIFPESGLFIWAIGFGFLHILYGTVMHFKYER